jgi:undecaprenyl-diphosphatase
VAGRTTLLARGRERVRRVRAATFGPASEEPYRRRTSDWIRVATASVLLVVAARHAGGITATEQAIFDFFNTLPGWLEPLFNTLYRLGALWAVALVVSAAVFGRRWRLARDLLLAGSLAWGFGRLLGQVVVEGASLGHGLTAVARLGASPAFPAVRLAVLVAVVRVAQPYVTRPTRRIGRLIVVSGALAAMYLGSAYPNDVFGGLALGWAVAAAVHLLFGSPGGRPTSEQVRRSLAELGIHATDVRLAHHQPTGSTLMSASDPGGPLRIKVIGRDEADAQFLAKLWRSVVYRDSGPRLALTRLHQVEHEAFLMLLARDRGVQVPTVLAAGTAGPRAALLVHRPVAGTRLADLEPALVDNELLRQVWEQVNVLHASHITHGQLDADRVVVAPDGPYLVDFAASTSTRFRRHVPIDVSQLLAATAAIVGDRRAVEAAAAAVGTDAVHDAIALLQPAVLTRATRHRLAASHGDRRGYLGELRTTAASVLGVEPPELVQLQRVRGSSLLLAVGTLVAAGVLLGDVGEPGMVLRTFRDADWSWISLALALSLASNIGFALGLQGTVPLRLPIWPTTELQVAMSFSNLAIPGIGGIALQVRFLQKQGVDLSSAVAAGGLLSTVGNLAAAILLFVAALVIEPADVDWSLLPTAGLAELTLYTAAGAAAATALVGGIPRLRRAVMPPVARAASTIWSAMRSPRHLALLLGGNVLATLLATWCLAACLLAFGGHVSFWPLLAANIGVITVASIVPVPGGGTAVGTVGLSAVLVAFGVREDIAVATALAYQLIYFYLPAVPGWFATRHLARNDYL